MDENPRRAAMMRLAGRSQTPPAPPAEEEQGTDPVSAISAILADVVRPETLDKILRMVQEDMGAPKGEEEAAPAAEPMA